MSHASKGKCLSAVLPKLRLVLVLFCASLVSISLFVPVLFNHQFASGASTTASPAASSSSTHRLPNTPILSPNATTQLQGKVIRVPLFAKINVTTLKKPLPLPGPAHEAPDTFAPPPFALPPKEQVKSPTKVITLRPANTTTTTTTTTKTNATSSISSAKSNRISPLPSSRLDPIQFTGIKGLKECQVGPCISPPDFGLAAGDNYIVQLVNSEVEIINPPPVVFPINGSVASPPAAAKSILGNCDILAFCPVRVFDLKGFFGLNGTSHNVFDPEIIFDPQSDRWFASAFDDIRNSAGSTTSTVILLAVSSSNNPNGTWHVYRFNPANSFFADEPAIGVSSDKVIISFNDCSPNNHNCFPNINGTTFKGVEFFVAMKQDLIAGASSLQMYDSGEHPGLFGMIPMHEASPICINSTAHLCNDNLIMASNSLGNAMVSMDVYGKLPHIRVSSMDPSGLATDHIHTPPCPMPQINSSPSGANQKGTNTLLPAGSFHLHEGGMPFYTSYAVTTPAFHSLSQSGMAFMEGCTPDGDNITRICIRLFAPGDITSKPTGEHGSTERTYKCGQPEVNLDIAGPPGTYLFYPSLSVDSAGNWDIIFGYSSSNDYPSLGFTVLPRTGISCHANPSGTGTCVPVMATAPEPPITLIRGTAPDTTGRYGDYSQTTTDPSDPSFVYAGGEIPLGASCGINPHNMTNCWSTFIAHASGP